MFFRPFLVLALCLVALAGHAQEPAARGNADNQRMAQLLQEGVRLLKAGKPQEAIDQAFDKVITHYEGTSRKGHTFVFSSRSPVETLMYMLEVANNQASAPGNAAVFSPSWGDAYYLRGYALVELKRLADARAALESAVALAPRNSHYLSELGNLTLMERRWPAAMEVFKRAEAAAREFSPQEVKAMELGRALRGQGYVLIEQNQLDEAEKIYRECLRLDPNDAPAAGQLRYIQLKRSVAASIAAGSQPVAATGFDAVWARAEAQYADPEAARYVRQWQLGAVWNDGGRQRLAVMPEEKALLECVTAVFPSPSPVRLAFVVDEKGVVQEAHTDQTGYVDSCVKSKIPGLRIPAPPTARFLLCTRYEKKGEHGSVVTGCGPTRMTRVCALKGTTRSCSVYQQ